VIGRALQRLVGYWFVVSHQRRMNSIVAGMKRLFTPPFPGVSTPGSALCGKTTRDYISIAADFYIAACRRHPPSTAWWEAIKLLLAYQGARMLLDGQQARRQQPAHCSDAVPRR